MSRETTEPEMLIRFIDGLKQAAGSAHQLAHAQQRPQWLTIRNMLEAMISNGTKLAASSPTPRQDVLAQLDRRQKRMVVQ